MLPLPISNQPYVHISAIAGGHITLPDSAFVAPANPTTKRYVPSLSFLITHPGIASPSAILPDLPLNRPLRVLFDLGLRQDAKDYLDKQQNHLSSRKPYQLYPGVPQTLINNGIPLNSIDLIILSHVHYDHHGDPSLFTSAQFLLGPGALDVLKNGLPPELGSHQIFQSDLLPMARTTELPSPKAAEENLWNPLGPFPNTLDLLGDGTLFVVDTPGHLPGHINFLCRLFSSPSADPRWICLAGDAFHDKRLLTGEREIGTWKDTEGRTCCIHLDRSKAEESIARLRELTEMGVEIVAAHDEGWERDNSHRFLPGHM